MVGFWSRKKKGANNSKQAPIASVALFVDSSRLASSSLSVQESYHQYVQTKGYSSKDGESGGSQGILLYTPTSTEALQARDDLREIIGFRSAVKLVAPHPGHEAPLAPEF